MTIVSTPGPMAVFITARPNGRFIKAEATGRPDLQILEQVPISLLSRTINLSAAGPSHFQAKSGPMAVLSTPGPMAVLSTPGPMAVLSRHKQPDGQTCRFEPQIAISLLSRTINLPAAGPSHFQAKAGQWPFYQRQVRRSINARPNGRFIKVEATGRPESRPPDFSNNLQFRY